LIDSTTNKLITDRAPGDYLGEIAAAMGTDDRDRILQSHVIQADARAAMVADDYESFISARANDIAAEIVRVTGKVVTDDQA
jgi:hypothetical protein